MTARQSHLIKKGSRSFITYVILVALGLCFAFPFVYMVAKSLMTSREVLTLPPPLFPKKPQWQNYIDAMKVAPFGKYAVNTLIIIGVNIVAVPCSAIMCAYAFARLNFFARDKMFAVVLACMMLPSVVVQIPLYVTFSKLNWIGTFMPLTVPAFFGGGAINIFLMRQFIRNIPKELDNAAMMDGANKWQIFTRLIVPLSLPVITLVMVNTFSGIWNDFMGPLIYLKDPNKYTLALGLYNTFRGTLAKNAWPNYMMAVGTIMIIPPAALFFAFQRQLVSGVVTTGLKV